MRTIVEDRHLPVDINAQPVVQAADVLKPTLRHYQGDIEREQRLSPELVEQMHAAGFYRLLLPRSLGGLQADPLTYIRVVELLPGDTKGSAFADIPSEHLDRVGA